MKKLFFVTFLLIAPVAMAAPMNRTSCQLPAAQGIGSLEGRWAALPVQLVFDEEFYKQDGGRPAAALKRAVKSWNEWAKLKGMVAFTILNDGKGAPIPSITNCSQSDYTAASLNAVGVWQIIGSSGDHANQRPSCAGAGTLLPSAESGQTDWIIDNGNIAASSVLLNGALFRGAHPKADLETEFLHELGHVLGLLHSCNGSTGYSVDSTSAPACDAAPAEFVGAVMAPHTAGLVRRHLQPNDYARVNCLY